MSLAMTEYRGARSPGVAGDDRAPRSPQRRRRCSSTKESPVKLARSEHRGVPGVAGDVSAVKCAHLVLEHEESECRGVTSIASDEARAMNSLVNWSAMK